MENSSNNNDYDDNPFVYIEDWEHTCINVTQQEVDEVWQMTFSWLLRYIVIIVL